MPVVQSIYQYASYMYITKYRSDKYFISSSIHYFYMVNTHFLENGRGGFYLVRAGYNFLYRVTEMAGPTGDVLTDSVKPKFLTWTMFFSHFRRPQTMMKILLDWQPSHHQWSKGSVKMKQHRFPSSVVKNLTLTVMML